MNRVEVRLCVERIPGSVKRSRKKDVEVARAHALDVLAKADEHDIYPSLEVWIEQRTVTDWVRIDVMGQQAMEVS